jgi:hypothetical protein
LSSTLDGSDIRPSFVNFRIAVQNVADREMRRICSSRNFVGADGCVGIWNAVDATIKAIESDRSWPFKKPDIETVRRLIAYLADPDELDDRVPRPTDSPPKWRHLDSPIADVDPRTGHVRDQSGYVPVEGV